MKPNNFGVSKTPSNGIIIVSMVGTMRRYTPWVGWLRLSVLFCGLSTPAQSQQPPVDQGTASSQPDAGRSGVAATQQLPDQQPPGSISGSVVDQTGAPVPGARVKLSREDQSAPQEVLSDGDGRFTFAQVAPGPFGIAVDSQGFAAQTSTGTLRSGENYTIPQITLAVATAVTEVHVVPSRIDVAEDQIKVQEKQRVLGVVPNFYVSYVHNPAPLAPKQKFELAWKTAVDPVSFGVNGAVAGIQQAQNEFEGYGQGGQGYAKRYGASYANFLTSTFIGGAILPSLLKQDPRYFYKGSGSKRSRILYALANSVICKSDDGHWQANYSSIIGSLAAGGISNLYYPAKNREGVELTFENALIGIGESAAMNLFQEFVVRKLTPSAHGHAPASP
jgi:hypothetical protein